MIYYMKSEPCKTKPIHTSRNEHFLEPLGRVALAMTFVLLAKRDQIQPYVSLYSGLRR